MMVTGQSLITIADSRVEAIPKERTELLGFLLDEVLVDVAEARSVRF
jgi:hypothetical protein